MLIDAHIHWCVFGRPLSEVVADLEWLENYGYDAVIVLPLPGMGAPPERAVNLIPGTYRDFTGIDEARIASDDLVSWLAFKPLWAAKPRRMEVLPFLDVRAWDGEADIGLWWGEGHAGFKNILILEEDEAKMRMPPLRHVPAIGREAYLEAHRKVFALAAQKDAPVLYHADLSLHAGFVEECLSAHPTLRVSIPHFGFSRKVMARMFTRFPNLVSDVSSLLPYMQADSAAYRSFIKDFPDRIMLGSDAIACHDLKAAAGYVECAKGLGLGDEVLAALLGGNAARFLAWAGNRGRADG